MINNVKKRRQKDILYISISSFILTVLWIGFSVYHNWATTTISEALQVQIQPIEPNFDIDTLEKLKSRKPMTPIYESRKPSTLSPTESDTDTTTPADVRPTRTSISPTVTPEQPSVQPLTPTPTNQVLIQGI